MATKSTVEERADWMLSVFGVKIRLPQLLAWPWVPGVPVSSAGHGVHCGDIAYNQGELGVSALENPTVGACLWQSHQLSDSVFRRVWERNEYKSCNKGSIKHLSALKKH